MRESHEIILNNHTKRGTQARPARLIALQHETCWTTPSTNISSQEVERLPLVPESSDGEAGLRPRRRQSTHDQSDREQPWPTPFLKRIRISFRTAAGITSPELVQEYFPKGCAG